MADSSSSAAAPPSTWSKQICRRLPPVAGGTKKAGLLNRFDNPWMNWKFLSGAGIIGFIFFLIFLGNQFGIRNWRWRAPPH